MVELVRQHVEAEPATLFVVGSYHIGKERAYIGPARALGWRIYCPPAKLRVRAAVFSACRTLESAMVADVMIAA